MRRVVAAFILPLLVLIALAHPVGAGEIWCEADPVVRLNGTQISIVVGIPADYQPLVDGAIRVEIATPPTTRRELLLTDAGFNGHGESVAFTDLAADEAPGVKRFTTRITVHVPLDRSRLGPGHHVPVRVLVTPENDAPMIVTGTSERTAVSLTVRETKGAPRR